MWWTIDGFDAAASKHFPNSHARVVQECTTRQLRPILFSQKQRLKKRQKRDCGRTLRNIIDQLSKSAFIPDRSGSLVEMFPSIFSLDASYQEATSETNEQSRIRDLVWSKTHLRLTRQIRFTGRQVISGTVRADIRQAVAVETSVPGRSEYKIIAINM